MTVKHVSFNEREEKTKRVRKQNNRRREKALRNMLNSGAFCSNIDYTRVFESIEEIL
jgi:phage anti-repressor protein